MKRLWMSLCLCVLCFAPAFAGQRDNPNELLVKSLPWRNLGPAIMGGRIDDFAVVESNPNIFYVGTAAGGVFKTVNNGTTWESVFDSQPCISIGDVTVAPSNPDIVWVGTGEANNRQSSSWGNGVYKSTDAGKTWTCMGLPESRHIGRIVIDSKKPDTVFVAAGGDLWGPSKERGVYKTEDGGKAWTQSLAVNENTGCTDLAMDPQDPSIVYAAMYQRRRTASGFNGGGPGSGIYKTSDGGAHWKRLTEGLPTGDTGRIGLDIYRKNPNIVYACIENASGGVFRSEDKGETWKKMGTVNMGINAFRPMYFSQIRVDPNNDQTIMMAGVQMGWSSDGGKTFRTDPAARIHADVHAIWMDPANSNHILVGCDGGVQWTYDQGKSWDYHNTLPVSQFYELAYDMRKPYWVYGGLQDNGSWGAPNLSLTFRGITNDDWMNVGGGDGFYCQADPVDANTVYSESQQGAVARLNVATGERKSIRPRVKPGEKAYRFDWNTPILISSHDHNRIYLGGNKLFISDDRGDTWRSSPDLSTSPDVSKIPIMGVMPSTKTLSLNDGQVSFGQIVTISESPVQAGVLYAGTDDGCLQVSRDDGRTWKNVAERVPGVPKGTYVTRILASRFASGRAYATFDGHKSSDFKPYVFVTEDFGETWKPLASNLQDHYTVKAIREHPRNPSLLFLGTERGAFVSLDRGGEWTKLGAPLPSVPVNDIQIHPRENDLILATHGRGVWILDDITPLEQLADRSTSGSFVLFDPRPAVEYRYNSAKGVTGNRIFIAANPPAGALIQYYIKTAPPSNTPVKLTIMDKSGKQVISEFRNITTTAGVNRLVWNMRYTGPTPAAGTGAEEDEQSTTDESENDTDDAAEIGQLLLPRFMVCLAAQDPQPPAGQNPGGQRTGRRGQGRQGGGGQGAGGPAGQGGGGFGQGGGGFGQGGGRGGFGSFGPRVLPGTYLVRMTIGTEEQTKPLQVEDDPRIHLSDRDRKARYEMQLRAMHLTQTYAEARRSLTALRTDLTALQKSADTDKASQPVKDSLSALAKEVADMQSFLNQGTRTVKPTEDRPQEPTTQTESAPPAPGSFQVSVMQQRLALLSNSLESLSEPVTRGQRQEADELADTLHQIVDAMNSLNTNGVVTLNKSLTENKLKTLPVTPRIARPR